MRNSIALLLVAVTCIALSACSSGADSGGGAPSSSAGSSTGSGNSGCDDFPVNIPPSPKNLSCNTSAGPPLSRTASFETADALDLVVRFYQSQEGYGWVADPVEVNTPEHAVVLLKKAPGYANITINKGASGTSVRINCYPNGN